MSSNAKIVLSYGLLLAMFVLGFRAVFGAPCP